MIEYSDARLRSYFDGDMPRGEAQALETALEMDTALEARMMALDPLAGPVRAAFEVMPGPGDMDRLEARLAAIMPREDTPVFAGEPDVPDAPVAPARGGFGQLALVAAVAGALGVGLTFLARPAAEAPGWVEQVAIYQALYSRETVAHLDMAPEEIAAQMARAGAAVGLSLDAEQFGDVPGLTLERAQVLSFDDTPLVQIVFTSETGLPVAFCIIATPEGSTETAVFETVAGVPTSLWGEGDHGFMVLGRIEDAQLRAVTDRLRAVF